jgi:hypothetical protein
VGVLVCCGWAAPASADPPVREYVALELGLGYNLVSDDDEFLRRTESFDFGPVTLRRMRGDIALAFDVIPQLAVVVGYARIDKGWVTREGFDRAVGGTLETPDQTFAWTTGLWSAKVRGQLPLTSWCRPYLQVGGGMASLQTSFDAIEGTGTIVADEQVTLGPGFAADIGIQLMPTRIFGAYFASGLSYAPVLENELGEFRAPLAGHITGGLRLAWPAKPADGDAP